MRYAVALPLIIFLSCGCVNAQNGHLGKHFEIYVNTQLIPAWWTANHNEESGLAKFDIWFDPGISYIIGNKASIGIEYHTANTKYVSEYKRNDWEVGKPAFYSDIHISGFGLYYKYNWDLNAPLGAYFAMQLDRYSYIAEYNLSSGVSYDDIKSAMYGLQLRFGITRVIAKHITFSPNISFGFSKGEGKITNEYEALSNSDGPTLGDKKIRQMGYLKLGLQIGFLAI